MTRVLVVEPDESLRAELSRAVACAGYDVEPVTPGAPALSRLAHSRFDAALFDVSDGGSLDALDRACRTAFGTAIFAMGAAPAVEFAVECMKRGARDFLRKPFSLAALEAALSSAVRAPAQGRARAPDHGGFLTEDPVVEEVLRQAGAAAGSDATVLIMGESGTGKDLLTRSIHRSSARRGGPYVVVDCAATHDALAESELFGHEKGAFSGATRSRVGQVRAANGGTLVLDHVGDATPALQPKMLRMLQEREVLPLGAERPEAFDARIIATAQTDLAERVAGGRFREDLYFRLDVIALRLPPLRARPADLRLLARHFLERFSHAQGVDPPRLSESVFARLAQQPFRGNVRELENLMRRAVLLFPGREADVDALLRGRGKPAPRWDEASRREDPEILDLKELERRAIVRSLERSGGNRTRASRTLGISVRTLRNKIRQYGLA